MPFASCKFITMNYNRLTDIPRFRFIKVSFLNEVIKFQFWICYYINFMSDSCCSLYLIPGYHNNLNARFFTFLNGYINPSPRRI